jgi:hypothetical protein
LGMGNWERGWGFGDVRPAVAIRLFMLCAGWDEETGNMTAHAHGRTMLLLL